MKDKRSEIDEEFEDRVREDLFGPKPQRTVEDALQEALDNTTPDTPGIANHARDRGPVDRRDEWI